MPAKIQIISKIYSFIRKLFVYLHTDKCNNMDKVQMINHIKQTAARVLPKGSTLYLYGSRARGDYHEDSDWDLLVLIDKPKLAHEDFDKYSYPFVLMGWDLGADVRPLPIPKMNGLTVLTPCFTTTLKKTRRCCMSLNENERKASALYRAHAIAY